MQLDVIATSEGLAGLREQWQELERRDPHASYYLTHRYVTAWWLAHEDRPDLELHVARVRNNGRLVGIAPLVIATRRPRGRRTRVLRFAGTGDYLGPLLDPDASAGSVCKMLREHIESGAGWDRVNLGNIAAYSPWAHHLLKSPQNASFTVHVECPYVDLAQFGDLDAFIAHGGVPAQLRNRRNKLYRECNVAFRVWRGDQDDILARIVALHRREKEFLVQHKARTERYSLFEDPARMAHIRALFTGTDDVVTFGYETPAGELVGYITCFEHRRTMLSWNIAYHPDYEQYRIGKVLHYDTLAHLFDTGEVDRFDFGAGRYPWKFEWTETFHLTYRWQLNLQAVPGPEPAASSAPVSAPVSPAPAPVSPVRRTARGTARRLGLGRVRRLGRAPGWWLTRLRPPVVWYVPHPDDETIFMGGSISAHRDRRNILVVLTRGGASGAITTVNRRLDEPLTHETFMRARQRELAAAAAALGVRSADVLVHDLPDGGLEVDAVQRIVADMARRHPRASHRTMSYLDPHRDHAVAGEALRRAHESGVVGDCLFHLPVPLVGDDLGAQVRLDEDAVAAKRAALREYQRWDPQRGRYGVGSHSVAKLIDQQARNPRERTHGPDYRSSDGPPG